MEKECAMLLGTLDPSELNKCFIAAVMAVAREPGYKIDAIQVYDRKEHAHYRDDRQDLDGQPYMLYITATETRPWWRFWR